MVQFTLDLIGYVWRKLSSTHYIYIYYKMRFDWLELFNAVSISHKKQNNVHFPLSSQFSVRCVLYKERDVTIQQHHVPPRLETHLIPLSILITFSSKIFYAKKEM